MLPPFLFLKFTIILGLTNFVLVYEKKLLCVNSFRKYLSKMESNIGTLSKGIATVLINKAHAFVIFRQGQNSWTCSVKSIIHVIWTWKQKTNSERAEHPYSESFSFCVMCSSDNFSGCGFSYFVEKR